MMEHKDRALEQIPADTSRALSSRISGALVTFLKKVKEASLKDSLYIIFPQLVEELRESGFFVIPTRQKKPCGVNFKTQEDKEKANRKPVDTEASLILPPWLAVVDIDDPETFCKTYRVVNEDIEKVATVKTGRGYHIYILDPEGKIHHRPLNSGWEVKRGHNLLVVLPGSRMHHPELDKPVCYEVINPNVWEFAELPDWLRSILMQSQKDQESELPETPVEVDSETKDSETERSEVDWEKLKELILSYYSKGQRQNLVIYTAAWLKKLGISEENIWSFLENLISQAGDEEFKMRLSGIKKTLSKDEQVIKGWTGLVEDIGIPPQDLQKCIIRNSEEKNFQSQARVNLESPSVIQESEKALIRNEVVKDTVVIRDIEKILNRMNESEVAEIMYYLGLLYKNQGYTFEEALGEFIDIIEKHDLPVKTCFKSLQRSFSSSDQYNTETILNILSQKYSIDVSINTRKISSRLNLFRKYGDLIFFEKRTKNGFKEEPVGPAITVESIVEDILDSRKLLLCKYKNSEFVVRLDKKAMVDTVVEVTGIPVISEQDFREYVALQATLCSTKKILLKTIGWIGDEYYHPCLQNDDTYIWKMPDNDVFTVNQKDKQHRLVKEALKEGKLLGLIYLLAVSSLFCRKKGFTVFFTGTSRMGKTVCCMLGGNLFYKCYEYYITTNATLNGIEVLLKHFKNCPILIDELKLSSFDEEKLIFMIESGKGKVRATKTLELSINDIAGTVFVTSERAPEIKTTGALRRCLMLSADKSEDFTEIFDLQDRKTVNKYLAMVGAGLDYVPVAKTIAKKVTGPARGELSNFGFLTFIDSVYQALKTLEEFYGCKFLNLRKNLIKVLQEHVEEFDKRINVVEYFVEKFNEFVLNKRNFFIFEFYQEETDAHGNTRTKIIETDPVTREIYGKIYSSGDVFILSSVFNQFCRENGFDTRILLKRLHEEGFIQKNSENKYTSRVRIKGMLHYGYYIMGDKIFQGDEDSHVKTLKIIRALQNIDYSSVTTIPSNGSGDQVQDFQGVTDLPTQNDTSDKDDYVDFEDDEEVF